MLSQITLPKRLEDVDTVDLAALSALKEWGVSLTETRLVKPEACEREHCGGSHLAGFSGCHLCGR